MLDFLHPAYLLAAGLLALVPPLLHLIARRPPERIPFPTARFLRPDPHLAVRVQRRPTDLLLLLLRSLLLLLLGAGVAAPVWSARPGGRMELVLLDRAEGDLAVWRAAVDTARALLLPTGGMSRRELVLFDSAAVHIPASALSEAYFDSLASARPSGARLDYAAALHAIPGVIGAASSPDSTRVTLMTRPRWEGWSPGLARLRTLVWAGPIRLVELSGAPTAPPGSAASPPREGTTRVESTTGGGAYVRAALSAVGWTATSAADAALHVVLSPAAAGAADLRARARAGAVVIVAGAVPPTSLGDALPWDGQGPSPSGAPGVLVLDDGTVVEGASARADGRPRGGARTLAVWEDGRPAAAAIGEGTGCLVFVGTDLEAGALPLSPRFPALLDRLSRGCEDASPGARDDRPLDAGARAVLAGSDSTRTPAVRAADVDGGRPLGRWLLAAALGLAVIETGIAYRGRQR